MLTWRDTQPVWEKLMELGHTSDLVANSLREKGIKGFPRSSHSCPVTIYLEKQGFDTYVHYTYTRLVKDWNSLHCINPQAVEEFIYRFDKGEFPDLVESRD